MDAEQSKVILSLVAPKDYQGSRAHLFPSIESLRWFIRCNKATLIAGGALLEIAGRTRVNPAAFDAVVLAAGKKTMADREGIE